MGIETVGIVSPGDMGHSVGAVLKAHGARVVTVLEGRSERTKALAAKAGIEALPTLEALMTEADAVLSIMVPGEARDFALSAAQAMGRVGAKVLYVDCNAISAATSIAMAAPIEDAGGVYVDASIIGPPPRKPGVTRFYASGPDASQFGELSARGLDIRIIGGEIGQASYIKTCYASMTKGMTALATQALVAARHLNLDQALMAELEASQPVMLGWIQRTIPAMPPKAHRWIGEMEEHAAAYDALGLSPKPMQGAADLYRMVADTPPGRESPEARDPKRDLMRTIEELAEAMPLKSRKQE